MAHPLQDELKKPLKQQIEELFNNSREEFISTLSQRDYFRFLMEEREMSIESLAENSELSVQTINNFRCYNNLKTKRSTLKKLCLKGFKLSLYDSDLFFKKYNYLLKDSNDIDDIHFVKKLKILNNPNIINASLFSSNKKKDIIKQLVVLYPYITQDHVACILKLSRRTIIRYFHQLSIINIGSKKKPKWQIKE